MNRWIAALTLLAIATPGCMKAAPRGMGTSAPAAEAAYGDYGGDGGGAADYASAPSMASGEGAAEMAMEEPSASMADDGASLRMADRDEAPGFDPQLSAGRLTAGTFDDTLNPTTFASFLTGMRNNPSVGNLAAQLDTSMSIIEVVDDQGRPVADAEVSIGMGNRSFVRRRTGTDGRVVLLGGLDYGRQSRMHVSVGQQQAKTVSPGGHVRLFASGMRHEPIRALDLALVIDATGSMADELEYLKVELRNIAQEVKAEFPEVEQRFALVVYRDQGDEYVTRKFDFSADLGRFERRLGQQRAGGGGDYPEAMDVALEDAADLGWRTGADTARVAFLIADAPPHAQDVGDTIAAVQDLRDDNVAMYPIAASGVASEAELVMRTAAAATGGQYLFLTDDSGVGNGHAEPHVPCYEVERLRDAMARMLVTELAGKRIDSDPRHAIRRIGQSNAGVCAPLTLAQ